jgi:Flp pilus assembly pilin Flp
LPVDFDLFGCGAPLCALAGSLKNRANEIMRSRSKPIGGVFRMIRLNNVIARLVRDRRAVTALEYGIIAGVFGLVLILIFQNFGTTLSTLMSTIGKSI